MKICVYTAMIALVLQWHQGAYAQGLEYLPDHMGKWQNKIQNDRLAPYNLTPEEKKAIFQRTDSILQLIKTYPAFSAPKGMELIAITGAKYISDEQSFNRLAPIPLTVTVEMCNYYNKNGKPAYITLSESNTKLLLCFNDPELAFRSQKLDYNGLYDSKGNELFFEPEPLAEYHDIKLYSNGVMILTPSAKKLWKTVSAKQYLEAHMYCCQQKINQGQIGENAVLDLLKKEMSAFTAAELEGPAYISNENETISHLSIEKSSKTTPVVMIDRAFFDKAISRQKLQLLVIDFYWASNYEWGDSETTPVTNRNENNVLKLYSFLIQFNFKMFQKFIE